MNSIDWRLGIGITLSVVSMYLRFRAVGRAFDFLSAGLAGIGLCLLAVSAAESPGWWPESDMDSATRQFVFWLMSLLCVVGAAFAVTANDRYFVLGGCGSLFIGTAGLLVLNDLAVLGSSLALITAIGGCNLCMVRPRNPPVSHDESSATTPSRASAFVHEPLLACIVGGVIGAMLLGSMRAAMFEEAYFSQVVQDGKSLLSKRHSTLPLVKSPVPDTNSQSFWTLIPLGGVLCAFAAAATLWTNRQNPRKESLNDSI